MAGLISVRAVREMLAQCAPGYKMELKTHNWFVYYKGLTYHALPKYDEIEEFHIRKLGRSLGILECAKKFFSL
jgi:hypothetical protein